MIKCENECWKGFNLCCTNCEEKETCGESCLQSPEDCGGSIITKDVPEPANKETALAPFETKQDTLITNIKNLYASKATIEAQEKALKEQLKSAMEEFGIKKFEKENHPDIFVECSKKSNKSAYVKVTVK